MKITSLVLMLLIVTGCREVTRERVEWTTMGTVAAVQSRSRTGARLSADMVATVSNVFSRVEKLLNAHDPKSELNRLAALTDGEILRRCDASVRQCYEAAFRFRDESGGVFDPRWRGARTLDLGGIAKGYALEVARRELKIDDEVDILLDLGGNLVAVKGDWRVGVLGGGEIALKEGESCATSAEYFRGKHIFDPRSGKAVSNEVVSVTVIAPSATAADALSTILFVLGRDSGERYLFNHHQKATSSWILRP